MQTKTQPKTLRTKGYSPEDLDRIFKQRHPRAAAKIELKAARQAQFPDQRGFMIGEVRL